MKDITYLIGAGASANCLPVIAGLNDRIKGFINVLNDKKKDFDSIRKLRGHVGVTDKSESEWLELLISDLKWLEKSSSLHASVDTFAKKLWIKQNSRDLKRLKLGLTIFFTYEQASRRFDFRYDSFFASILKIGAILPQNIKVISWNYDNQFELSYNEYSTDNNYDHIKHSLGINSKYGLNDTDYIERFTINKLNGSCLEIYDSRFGVVSSFEGLIASNPATSTFFKNLVKEYANAMHQDWSHSSLSFSWEGDSEKSNIVELAKTASENSEVLIVIGYSFPYFNRDIDGDIINSMTNLSKVYIQDINPSPIIARFKAIAQGLNDINIVAHNDVEQFLLPNELE
ncbi:MAG: hypothetical protein HWE07_01990 [Cytophagia bacterium]|nr:hypothetical protein [Cytophagia bacterium]